MPTGLASHGDRESGQARIRMVCGGIRRTSLLIFGVFCEIEKCPGGTNLDVVQPRAC